MPDLTCLIDQKTLQLLTSSQDATAVYSLVLADFQPWPLEIFEYHRHHPVQVKRTLAEWHQVLQKVSLAASSHAVSCCLQHLFRLRIFDFLFHHLLLLKKTRPTKPRWKFWEVPSWDILYFKYQRWNVKQGHGYHCCCAVSVKHDTGAHCLSSLGVYGLSRIWEQIRSAQAFCLAAKDCKGMQ